MWSVLFLIVLLARNVIAKEDLKVLLARNVIAKVKAIEGYMKKNPAIEEEKVLAHLDKGISNRELRWPLGIVKYYIDHDSYDYLVAERLRQAMNSIEEVSCVKFKPILEPWTEGYFMHFTNPSRVRECLHDTSANDTSLEITVTIGIDCLQHRDILHMLMHALGFKDEVTHPLRDQYVRILWDNINPSYHSLFRVEHENFPSRTEYDFNSVMHFHDRAFSKNGQATIAPLIPGVVIDPSRVLSPLDKMKLRLMFGHECNRREVGDLLETCKNALHSNVDKAEKPESGENESANKKDDDEPVGNAGQGPDENVGQGPEGTVEEENSRSGVTQVFTVSNDNEKRDDVKSGNDVGSVGGDDKEGGQAEEGSDSAKSNDAQEEDDNITTTPASRLRDRHLPYNKETIRKVQLYK